MNRPTLAGPPRSASSAWPTWCASAWACAKVRRCSPSTTIHVVSGRSRTCASSTCSIVRCSSGKRVAKGPSSAPLPRNSSDMPSSDQPVDDEVRAGLGDVVGVVTPGPVPLVGPDDGGEHAARQHVRVPGVLTLVDQAGDELLVQPAAAEDLAPALLAELVEVVIVDRDAFEVVEVELDLPAHIQAQPREWREPFERAHLVEDPADVRVGAGQQAEEQVLLGGDVVVETALEDAELLGDVLHRRLGIAVREEDARRGGQHLIVAPA